MPSQGTPEWMEGTDSLQAATHGRQTFMYLNQANEAQ